MGSGLREWIGQETDSFWLASLELVFAVTLILAAALLINLFLRRAAASVRHRIWALAMGGLLLLPMLCPVLPKFSAPLQLPLAASRPASPPVEGIGEPAAAVALAEEPMFAAAAGSRVESAEGPTRSPSASPSRASATTAQARRPYASDADTYGNESWAVLRTDDVLALVWALGTVFCLLATARSLWAERRLARSSGPASDPTWQSLFNEIRHQFGASRAASIGISALTEVPLTIGWLRPRIVLPEDCRRWTAAKRRVVLVHELSHVARHDVFWQIVARLACAAYWFHPLAWLADRRMRVERELACDDAVLRLGSRPDQYATVLLDVAAAICCRTPTGPTALAMAGRTSIERRIRAILQPGLSRLPVGPRAGLLSLLGAVLLVVLSAAVQPFAAPQVQADPPQPETVAAANKAVPPPVIPDAPPLGAAEPAAKAGSIRVRVVDSQGKSMPGMKVTAGVWTDAKDFKHNRDYLTDAEGRVVVELPKTVNILRLFVEEEGYVPLFKGWETEWLTDGNQLPDEYVFVMRKGTVIGGIVEDDAGQPIQGARVAVSCQGGDCLWSLAMGDDARVTDDQGRWTLDNVPAGDEIRLSLRVQHPDFITVESGGALPNAHVTLAALRAQNAAIVMDRGIRVTGTVTDANGRPIKDALVVYGDDPYQLSAGGIPCVFPTDAHGRYLLSAMPPGEVPLTIIAAGWAPQWHSVRVRADMPPQDFQMQSGKPLQLRFVDAAGQPIPGVFLHIDGWRGGQSLYNAKVPRLPDSKIPDQADANGLWEWTWAPEDSVKVTASVRNRKGFAPRELEIAGGGPPQTVTLKAEHRIAGSVTDAVTGEPIPAFTVIPLNVLHKDGWCAERYNSLRCKDGQLDYLATGTENPLRLRIEAKGYRTQDGPEFRVGDEGPRTQDFRMQPSRPIEGVVLDAAGQPAKNAEVLVATPTEQVELNEDFGNHRLTTDAEGRFECPDPGAPMTFVATTDAGFARADLSAGQHDAGTLRLQPWASVRGRFFDGGQPIPGATLFVKLIRVDLLGQPRIGTNHLQVTTDADGRFTFPRVPPGPVHVEVSLGPSYEEGFRSAPNVPLNLKPGQRVELTLGQTGASVTGKVKLTGKVPTDLDCTYSLNYLIRRSPDVEPPPALAALGFDIRNGWQSAWLRSQEGLDYLNSLQHWFVKLAADGSFRISGVPPGEYDLAIEIYAKPSGCLVDPLAKKVVRVTVTEADASRGALTLPEIPLTVAPLMEVGDTPAISFQRADGTTGSLADFRDRYTVLQFWASWCGTCKQQLPALRQLEQRIAARGFVTLGLSLDEDAAAWQTAIKRVEMPWQQGRLAAANEVGVSSVPAYWLLDPEGKIVAKVIDIDELASAVDNTVANSVEDRTADKIEAPKLMKP